MLGWMMRRAQGNAPNNSDDYGDTIQIDQGPDTPAPVFAARAFKSAIFGTPTPGGTVGQDDTQTTLDYTGRSQDITMNRTPTRPPGILLTPGTGASRRKKVSFNHEVLQKSASTGSLRKETLAGRKRTPLFEALEKSKSKKTSPSSSTSRSTYSAPDPDNSADEWEDEDVTDKQNTSHQNSLNDVTLDMAEPRSESGKYWKREHDKYRTEALATMEKLLKHKELSKSYAKAKDDENMELSTKLDQEKSRVAELERKIADLNMQVSARRPDSSTTDDDNYAELLKNLAAQTTLAADYKRQVTELESLLKDRSTRSSLTSRSSGSQLDTQRELRRAKSQLREVNELRREIDRLKAELASSERKLSRLEEDNKRLKTQTVGRSADDARVEDLKRQLREAREESRRKDDNLRQVKKEFEEFRDDAHTRSEDAKRVLERATDKIAQLQDDVRVLKRKAMPDVSRTPVSAAKEKPKSSIPSVPPSAINGTAASSTTTPSTDENDADEKTGPLRGLMRSLSRKPASISNTLQNNDTATLTLPPPTPLSRDEFDPLPKSRQWRKARDQVRDDTEISLDFRPDATATDRSSPLRPVRGTSTTRLQENRLPLGEGREKEEKIKFDAVPILPSKRGHHAYKRSRDFEVDRERERERDGVKDRGRERDIRDRGRERPYFTGVESTSPPILSTTTAASSAASRTALPPDRREAALARIEKRRAEKVRWDVRRRGDD
ncbi:hypothetical protein CFIMG_003669RAa [Ceratocystis fimbriata CBS 114723]|uniref:Spindle pole body-associated protein cut12 domain-containing protein n=1 Tax=Ceratocystis fimbriata CBS 114723 TaxID=1035309 RepID=A0A2C5XK74_9PEZI|nr:hypothetical protein CFIMG_003669RAa [Ceratocystis fimbriata CBS 114723]